MKKKLFTILTLALAVCSGAWGEANTTLIDGITLPSLPTGTYQGGTDVTHKNSNKAVVADTDGNSVMQASSPGYGTPTGDFSWTNAADPADGNWSTTGASWEAPSGSLFVGSTNYNNSSSSHNVAFARRCNLRNTRTFAYRFTNCGGVSALVKSQGTTDAAAACMSVYEVGSDNSLSAVGTVSSKTNAVDAITVDNLTKTKTYVAYIYGMNGSNGELYEIAFLAPPAGPKISASPTSVTLAATESGVAVGSSFTITGSNLTAGTYNLTVPSVTGLTVSPTSFTVASDGTVSQVVNVSYSSTENVPANTANITATVGEASLSVPVNYSASVNTWTLQTISTAKSWDFSKLSGGVQYSGDDLTTEHVYANISVITFPADFDATALAFTGEYPLRSGKGIAQNGTLRFNTSVPGTIVVKFSDTGTSASATAVKRYLVVNGNTTEYWASRENNGTDNPYDAQLNVTTEAIAVPAGDVTISGTSALIYSLLTFTPATATTVTLNDKGYATYSTYYDVEVSGADAYTAALDFDNATITCTKITDGKVPAGAGVLLFGDASAEVTLTPTTGAAALSGNDLKGTTLADGTLADKGSNDYYVLSGNTFKKFTGTTFSANKAYFEVASGVVQARAFSIVFGDESTGISQIETETKSMDGSVYSLSGQRVSQPVKGLYIVNGKKVLVK